MISFRTRSVTRSRSFRACGIQIPPRSCRRSRDSGLPRLRANSPNFLSSSSAIDAQTPQLAPVHSSFSGYSSIWSRTSATVPASAVLARSQVWRLAQGNEDLMEMAVAVVLLTNVAMFLRNLAILALFSPKALTRALWPLLAMAVVSAAISWNRYRRNASLPTELKISSPLSWARISKFGALFLLIQIAGDLAQRHLGELGFLALSVVGGLVSSASTTAAAALLVSRGQLTTAIGGTSVVLCSLSSALVDLPLVYQETRRNTSVIRSVAIASLLVAAVGLIGLAVTSIR